jgi:hypothetical protein
MPTVQVSAARFQVRVAVLQQPGKATAGSDGFA